LFGFDLDAREVIPRGERALLSDLLRLDRLLILRVELEVRDRKLSE